MRDQCKRHYQVPAAKWSDSEDAKEAFQYYLWLTQVQQGQCMKTIFEK